MISGAPSGNGWVMKPSLLFSALGLGLVLFACSGATTDVDEPIGESEEDLSKAKAACLGKTCGEGCTICPPGAKNCYEPAIPKQCNAYGRCSWRAPKCAIDAGPAPDLDAGDPIDPIDAGPAPYEPCGGKSCGDLCSICPPWDATCLETAVLKFCHSGGECLATPPACIPPPPPPPYDPCAGKACGDGCSICNPLDPDCFETAVLKQCNAAGQCVANVVVCN